MTSVAGNLIGSIGFLTAVWLGATALARSEPGSNRGGTPPAATQPTQSDEGPAEEPATAGPSLPTAEDVVEAFERDRPRNIPIQPTATATRAGEGSERPGFDSASRARLPDGFLLIDRTGRLVLDEGWWIFVFESDSESFAEPPMKLLPNRMLERMIFEAEGAAGGIVFIVSGEVTEFQGENYLLLRKLLRRRDHGNLEK